MNCHAVQNKILSLTDPRVVPMAISVHLAGCAACQVWAKQAARLEALLEQLPVPAAPGNKKAEMVEDLAGNNLVISRPLTYSNRKGSFQKSLYQNRTMIGGLAAAVLVVLGGWWLSRPGVKPEVAGAEPERDPFLQKMVQRYVSLSKAGMPADRLKLYGDMAEDLATQERTLARVVNSDGLKAMAELFEKVVKVGMVKQAENMPVATMTLRERAERKEQLDVLAKKLSEMATQAEKMTGEIPQDAKPALKKIVDSARDGEQKLRAMTTG